MGSTKYIAGISFIDTRSTVLNLAKIRSLKASATQTRESHDSPPSRVMIHGMNDRHATRRDRYNQKLIALSSRNLELEDSLRGARQERLGLQEEATRQQLHASELERLVRSLRAGDDDTLCLLAERTQRIVDLTLQVEKLQRSVLEESRQTLSPPSHPDQRSDKTRAAEGRRHEIDEDHSSGTRGHHATGALAVEGCDCCTRHLEKILTLEKELDESRNKRETLERSVVTLKTKNTEREIRSMTSLRQMRRQIDMSEHDRRRRQDIQAELEQRVAALEAEKEIDSLEIHRLSERCKNLEAKIRHASSCRESRESSDKKNRSIVAQSNLSAGGKPAWVILSRTFDMTDVRTSEPNGSALEKNFVDADVIRKEGDDSDCSDTEASTASHIGSDVCGYY